MHCTNWHELGRIDTSEKPHVPTCPSGPGQDSSTLYISAFWWCILERMVICSCSVITDRNNHHHIPELYPRLLAISIH
jgi:hypothetical protein